MPFSAEKADLAVRFFEQYLVHVDGQWAGQPFRLMDWQRDRIVRPLFGTLRDDGTRQYRACYCEVGRKNGKSSFAAGIALYLLVADHEPGAQVYGAAGDKDQAAIVFRTAAEMVRRAPALAQRLDVIDSTKRILHRASASFYRAIPADAAGSHGFNASACIVDEVHVQPSRDLIDVLTTSTGARRQPLTFYITTAGYDRNSICYELHDYATKVQSGVIDDPTFLPVLYGAEEGDDWRDPAVWRKANPSLGVTVTEEFLATEARKAEEVPAYQNTFRRLYLSQWTSQDTRWLDLAAWDACNLGPIDPDALKGRTCYAGLDLASTTDIAALVLVFPRDLESPLQPLVDLHYAETDTEQSDAEADESDAIPDEPAPPVDGIQPVEPAYRAPPATVYDVLPFFWVPKENLQARVRRDKVPYDVWERQGFITATEGNVIDYETIKRKIVQLSETYRLIDLGFDRWGATQITQQLTDEGITVVPVGQGYRSLSPPTKELLRLVVSRRINHGGNPVLRWMADNVRVTTDPAENVKPDKAKSSARIDGIVSLVMALDRAIRNANTRSVYESERGLLVL